jgi:uncharacterized membrane protein
MRFEMLTDSTPRHWKLGVFYFNPKQNRLFVAKRTGVPITLNFAKPAAWLISAALPATAVFGFLLERLHSSR